MNSTKYLQTSQGIQKEISEILDQEFKSHPFSTGVSPANAESVMSNYLAMSQAFPYLQSGSQKEQIFHCINTNSDVEKYMEVTTVVGNFLAWDETGGHHVLQKLGIAGLTKILQTEENFHSNLLKSDLRNIFCKDIRPNYTKTTQDYLHQLYNGLSSLDPVVRCANMVAFESHAGQMITALWKSLTDFTIVEKDLLSYFKTHVGGDDPAESYHVKMTSKMIDEIVSNSNVPKFLQAFKTAYSLSYSWCENVTNIV